MVQLKGIVKRKVCSKIPSNKFFIMYYGIGFKNGITQDGDFS